MRKNVIASKNERELVTFYCSTTDRVLLRRVAKEKGFDSYSHFLRTVIRSTAAELGITDEPSLPEKQDTPSL